MKTSGFYHIQFFFVPSIVVIRGGVAQIMPASYGPVGPPKGFSTPRGTDASKVSPSRHCQRCDSNDHWTFECSKSEPPQIPPKLSRTAELKLGIQRTVRCIAPAESEREKVLRELRQKQVRNRAKEHTGKERREVVVGDDGAPPVEAHIQLVKIHDTQGGKEKVTVPLEGGLVEQQQQGVKRARE